MSHTSKPSTIAHATPEDLEAIRGLLETCNLPHDDLTPQHLEHFLVDRTDHALRGVVGLEPYGDVGLLRSLAVAPDHRGHGIGGRLTDTLERRAQADGLHTLYLLTTTAADYFARRGYERMARDDLPVPIQNSEEATRLCPSSATCQKKELAPEAPGADAEPTA